MVLNTSALWQLRGIHKVGSTEFTCPLLLVRVRVDSDDAGGLDESRRRDDTETNGAAAEDSDRGVLCHICKKV